MRVWWDGGGGGGEVGEGVKGGMNNHYALKHHFYQINTAQVIVTKRIVTVPLSYSTISSA